MPSPDTTWSTRSRTWRSGPWSLHLRDDEFADIAYEGSVLLRSVRAVVRDGDWGTAALIVDRVRETDATLALHVRSDGLGSSFRGVVRVEARPQRLDIVCDLESEGDFFTNRTGLVVLHPQQVAGAPLRVAGTDGGTDETAFPTRISAHQPVIDIAGLAWLHEGFEVSLAFEGDVFEMEDQRNWSDASFKTYSRPLSLPFPYRIAAGERVRQTVSIRARRAGERFTPSAGADVISLTAAGAFPAIALGASTAPDPAPPLSPIGAALVVELDLRTTNWQAALARAEASAIPLDVRVVVPDKNPDTALAELAALLRSARVLRVAAFDPVLHVSDDATVAALRRALTAAEIDAPVVGGTRSHFTELNREMHRVPVELDGIVFATTPLFHTVGGEQLVESLAVQRLIAAQAVDMAAGRPVVVGPVTLRARFNNVATTPQPAPVRDDLSDGYGARFTGADDPRQSSDELAAWTVASAAALAVAGVAGLVYFEEWGPRGIRDASGSELPVAGAIRALASLHGGELLSGDSPDGLIWAIGARIRAGAEAGAGATILVANMADVARTVALELDGRRETVDVPAMSFIARDRALA